MSTPLQPENADYTSGNAPYEPGNASAYTPVNQNSGSVEQWNAAPSPAYYP